MFIWRTKEHSDHKLWMIFQQCGTKGRLSAKFLVKFIGMMGFLLDFFSSFTGTTIEIDLLTQSSGLKISAV